MTGHTEAPRFKETLPGPCVVLNVPANGDCCFYTLAEMLVGKDLWLSHDAVEIVANLRHSIIQHVSENREKYHTPILND